MSIRNRTIGFVLLLAAAALGCLSVAAGTLQAQALDASLENGTVTVGVSRAYGGAITWLSTSAGPNLVNNHDKGRQVQQSYYAGNVVVGPDQSPWYSPFPWNPVQAGDWLGNASAVLALTNGGGRIYVKTQPKLWDRNNRTSQSYMEQWITLHPTLPQVVIVDNALTSFRDPADPADEWGGPMLRAQELPAAFFVTSLSTIKSYTGSSPWQDDALTIVPSTWPASWFTATEGWAACVDQADFGVGVYKPGTTSSLAGMYKSPGSADPFAADTMYVTHTNQTSLGYTSVYSYRYYLIVGHISAIRSAVTQLNSSPPRPAVPVGASATGGNARVNLSWTAAPDAQTYNVKRATASGGPYSTVATGVTATTYADTSPANETTYFYVISAVNPAGESTNSAETSARPSVLNVNVPNHGFEVPEVAGYVHEPMGGAWTFGRGAGITEDRTAFTNLNSPAPEGRQVAFAQGRGYFVQWLEGFRSGVLYTVSFSAAQRANMPGPGQTWKVTLNGVDIGLFSPVPNGTAYMEYTTNAFTTTEGSHKLAFLGTNLLGGDNTVFIDNVRVSGTTINSPTRLIATPAKKAGKVDLKWTQSDSPNVVQNKIYRSMDDGGPYMLIATVPATKSYGDNNLSGGKTYYYVVTAVDGSGLESLYSNQASAKPK